MLVHGLDHPWRLRLAAALTLLILAAAPAAQAQVRVDLLTMGRGPALFARFGHAALHVHGEGLDLVYNYGYTRFSENIVWLFLRGELRFWVATSTLRRTMALYRRERRSVYRQRLALSDAEHLALAATLAEAMRPENRFYHYHHFRDNCATRLRDAIDRVTAGALRRAWGGRPAGLSYRDAVREGFAGRLDVLLLSELLLGRALDRPLDEWAASFLPVRLAAQLERDVGPRGPLAGPRAPLLVVSPAAGLAGSPLAGVAALWGATALFAALAGIGLLGLIRRRRWAGIWLIPWALLVGLAGALVCVMAAVATIPLLRHNELLLLLWPTDLLLVGVGVRWLRGRFVAGRLLRGYCLARVVGVAAVCAGHLVGLLHQQPRAWLALVGIPLGLLWFGVRRLPAMAPRSADRPR